MHPETSTEAAALDPGHQPIGRWRFERFEFDLQRGTLSGDGHYIPLRPKAFALLQYLLSHPGRLISRDELLDKLWPGVVVTDDSVTQCVSELRAALGDGEQRLIRTVARRGYRLETTVRHVLPSGANEAAEPALAGSPAVACVADGSGAAGVGGGAGTDGAAGTGGVAGAGGTAGAGSTAGALSTVGANSTAVADSTAGEDRAAGAPRRLRPLMIATVLALLALCAGLAWWWPSMQVSIDRGVLAQRAIAVLPFADLGDPPSPALAQAVTEDLTVALSHLGNTVVFSSGSTDGFSDGKTDPQTVGRMLVATHVLTGSVRRHGDAVLIQVRLNRADTGAVVWSDRFLYQGDKSWDWQLDIGQRVANALDTRLYEAYLPKTSHARGELDAVEATQRGLAMLRSTATHDDLLNARRLVERALVADSNSVIALTALGFTYTVELARRWGGEREPRIQTASDAFERAIALQPDYAMAYLGRSHVLYMRGRVDEAAVACEQVLARWPNEPRTLQRLGFLRLQQGRPAEVEPLVRLSIRLNPLAANHVSFGHFILGMAHFHLHQDEEAYQQMRRAVSSNPTNGFGWQWMAAIDALHGRDEQARSNLARFRKLIPNQTVSSLKKTETATSSAFHQERERFYVGLAKAGLEF